MVLSKCVNFNFFYIKKIQFIIMTKVHQFTNSKIIRGQIDNVNKNQYYAMRTQYLFQGFNAYNTFLINTI